jgi:hypothetical protein
MSDPVPTTYPVAIETNAKLISELRARGLIVLDPKDDDALGQIKGAITPQIADPAVKLAIYYIVECGADGCDSFEEGCPGGNTVAEAIANAVDIWEMVREPDGMLYCEHCADLRAKERRCSEAGHTNYSPWRRDSRGGVERRACRDCWHSESRAALAALADGTPA